MCGIYGFWCDSRREREEWEDVLRKGTSLISHRGPDDQGLFLEKVKDTTLGLGHRRLSIIDLSTVGRQPMTDEEAGISLVYNGEIYNFRELRSELEGRGYKFRTRTDTEVIIKAYREYGLDVFRRLDGMFALAIWDSRSRKLILARDPFGKKPLFYYRKNKNLIFASELKAIMSHPDFEGQLDRRAVERFLFYGYLPSPGSIFKDVGKILPGHYMVIHDRDWRVVPYWKISFRKKYTMADWSHALEKFDDLFTRAVRKRLISDVPLGVFLSGGIDSSMVASYTRKTSHDPITTFSMGFEEEAFDELSYALKTAGYLNMENVNATVGNKDLLETVEKLPVLADEPLADSSIIPVYLLSRMTRENVTVALGGDGADELQAGYPTYPLHRYMKYYLSLPAVVQRAAEGTVGLIPPTFSNYNLEYGLKKFLQGKNYPPEIRHYVWMSYFTTKGLKEVLDFPVSEEDLFSVISGKLTSSDAKTDEEKTMYLNMRIYLPDSILAKVDRAAMAQALEVRAPFLDKALAEFLISLPPEMKMQGLKGKKLLRRSARGKVPPEVVKRRKMGFTPPMARWIKDDLKEMVGDLLGTESLKKTGFFREEGVRRLLKEHQQGRKDNWRQIWSLLVFQLWHCRYMGGKGGQ